MASMIATRSGIAGMGRQKSRCSGTWATGKKMRRSACLRCVHTHRHTQACNSHSCQCKLFPTRALSNKVVALAQLSPPCLDPCGLASVSEPVPSLHDVQELATCTSLRLREDVGGVLAAAPARICP